MKKLSLVLLLVLPALLFAQKNEGEITYTETVKLKIDIPDGPEAEAMRKMIPSERAFSKTLYFNEKESLFMDSPQQKEGDGDVNVEGGGDDGDFQFKMKMSQPENRKWRSHAEGKAVESTEFFGRYFLISEEPKKLKWKVGTEQKQILGYACQKAVLQDTTRKVEAWFTTAVPVAIGPGEFGDLPGIILEMSMMGGDRTIVATKVDLKKLDAKAIEKPTKGKAVTREEFVKIRDEKMKEMGAEPGGGGAMRVIIKN
jgi:GLPGLI family protein